MIASAQVKDKRWVWAATATAGDVMYRLRFVAPMASKAKYELVASNVIATFAVGGPVRLSGSPFGNEPIAARESLDNAAPLGWTKQENRYGYRFAHPPGWEVNSPNDRGESEGGGNGIELRIYMGMNQETYQGGPAIRPGLRTAFARRVEEMGGLSGNPAPCTAGIAEALAGHGATRICLRSPSTSSRRSR